MGRAWLTRGGTGHGSEADRFTPELVTGLLGLGVKMVACGRLHSVALTNAGAVYSWGYGDDGVLGHGNSESERLPRFICYRAAAQCVCQLLIHCVLPSQPLSMITLLSAVPHALIHPVMSYVLLQTDHPHVLCWCRLINLMCCAGVD